MKLEVVPPHFVDRAWKDGASELEKACAVSGGEITGSQLKMILSRNERMLIAMRDGESIVGWGVVRLDQLPNFRVYFITDLVCENAHFERFWDLAKAMAAQMGCSRIRCAADEARARLYRMKCGLKPVYTILDTEI